MDYEWSRVFTLNVHFNFRQATQDVIYIIFCKNFPEI